MLCGVSFAQQEIAVFITGELNSNEKQVLGAEILNAIVKSKRFTAKENSAAFMTEAEKKQGAEAVNENDIYELGRQFGLRYICIADVATAFGSHQVSARIIDIEAAEIENHGRASGQLNSMQAVETVSGRVVGSMLGIDLIQTAPIQLEQAQLGPVQPAPAQANIHQVAVPTVQNFTGAERFGALAINVLIPGLGSGIIMKDSKAAWTQAGIFAGGVTCFFIPSNTTTLIGWTGIILVNPVYNIYRSVTYNKPGSQPVTAASPHDFNFAVLPDGNGNLKTYAVYSISF